MSMNPQMIFFFLSIVKAMGEIIGVLKFL